MLKFIMDKIGAGYLFESSFQEVYLKRGVDCYVDFLDEVPSASQIKNDACTLYGALLIVCQSGVGSRILMENRDKQDGIRSWCQLVQQYETDGSRNIRIKRLENVINTVFHRNYRGGLVKWIQDYEGCLHRRNTLLRSRTDCRSNQRALRD
jgi:hypothetical protein